MIKVVAKNFAKENGVDKVIELAKELVEKTRKEVGCIKYEMYQDVKVPTELIIREEWESEVDLNNHMSSEDFKRIVSQMAKYLSKKAEINIYRKVF